MPNIDKISVANVTYDIVDADAVHKSSDVGRAGGVASLDEQGKLPIEQANTTQLIQGNNVQLTLNQETHQLTVSATDTVTNVNVSGSGNAITSMTATNGQITATKGETFITSTDSSLSAAMPVNADTLESHAASYFLPASKCTLQTAAPTEAISDGGVHIVYLTSEPTTKYDGYIYLIAEA